MKILEIRDRERTVRLRRFKNKRSDFTVKIVEALDSEFSCLNCAFNSSSYPNCSSLCFSIRRRLKLDYTIKFEDIRNKVG